MMLLVETGTVLERLLSGNYSSWSNEAGVFCQSFKQTFPPKLTLLLPLQVPAYAPGRPLGLNHSFVRLANLEKTSGGQLGELESAMRPVKRYLLDPEIEVLLGTFFEPDKKMKEKYPQGIFALDPERFLGTHLLCRRTENSSRIVSIEDINETPVRFWKGTAKRPTYWIETIDQLLDDPFEATPLLTQSIQLLFRHKLAQQAVRYVRLHF